MAGLNTLDLSRNLIGDDCVEVLVRGLVECKQLQELILDKNRISDDGLEVLIQGLPAGVDLDLAGNEIALARELSLLRFDKLSLANNPLSPGGPRIIAASLANPECRLEELELFETDIGDQGVATIATSLESNRRLTHISLADNIAQTGWKVLLSVLCNTSSVSATHGSNHTIQSLFLTGFMDLMDAIAPQDVQTMLQLNSGQDKNRVAATKILLFHRHLDMKPLFDRKLDLLPHVVAWLERFAESRPDLKLSSIFEFVRAMPMDVVDKVAGKKGQKRSRNA